MNSTSEQQIKKNQDIKDKEGVNIQVILRCRPPNKEESSSEICVKTSSKEVLVTQKLVSGKPLSKAFTFDHVYGSGSTQKELFESIKPLIDEVLMGYNCTIFAYGQTSTGKTYTMEGRRNDKSELIQNEEGIVPRTVDYIFEHLKKVNAEYTIRLSCLELYNEDLQDLLANEKKGLRLYDDPNGRGTTINGLEEVVVKNIKDLLQILDIAAKKRQVGETQLNNASSRSHVITTMTIHVKEQTPDGEEFIKTGKLYLVDLAGSENIGRSGAKKKRAQETGMINQSLLTLGRVITALTEKYPHVPYRESKLTRLLQDSLGGHTKTCIITTISPSIVCMEETLSTLEYARRAKTIKNCPEQNMKMTKVGLIKDMSSEIDQLKLELTASRLKNGVYLPVEMYQEKMELIENQGKKIESLEFEMEAMAKKSKDLQDQLDSLRFDLATEIKGHNQTKSELATCQNRLKEAEEEIECKNFEIGQTRYVLHETKKLESILFGEAETLLKTVQECVADIDLCQSKMETHQEVIATNKMSSLALKDNTIKKIHVLEEKISKFSTNYNKMTEESSCLIESFRSERANELEKNTRELQAIQNVVIQSLESIGQQVNDYKSSLGESSGKIHKRHDKFIRSIGSKLEESLQNGIDFASKLESLVANKDNSLNQLDTIIHQVLEKNRSILQIYSNVTGQILSEFKHKMTQAHQVHLEEIRNNQDMLRQSEGIQVTRLNETRQDLLKNIDLLLQDAFKRENKEYHLTSSVIQDSLTKTMHSLEEGRKESEGVFAKFVSHKEEMMNHVGESIKSGVHQVDAELESNRQVTTVLNKEASNFGKSNKETISASKGLVDKIHKCVAVFIEKSDESCDKFEKDIKEVHKQVGTDLGKNIAEIQQGFTMVYNNHLEFTQEVDLKEQNRHNQVTNSVKFIFEHCKQTQQDLEHFVNKDLKEVKTTNTTPKRKSLSFPKKLTKSKEEEILKMEYKEMGVQVVHPIESEVKQEFKIERALSPIKKKLVKTQSEPEMITGQKKSNVRARLDMNGGTNKKKKIDKENLE